VKLKQEEKAGMEKFRLTSTAKPHFTNAHLIGLFMVFDASYFIYQNHSKILKWRIYRLTIHGKFEF